MNDPRLVGNPGARPATGSPPVASPPVASPALERLWWVPLAFVVVSLLLLAMLPVIVNQRTRVIRHALVDVTEPARVNLSEIQAALNTELYGIVEIAHGTPDHGAGRYTQGMNDQLQAEQEMEPLIREMNAEAIARFAALRTSAAQWNAQAARRWLHPVNAADTSDRGAAAREQIATEVLAATVRLDSLLDDRAATQRLRIESLSNNDVLLPLALVPLMIVSALIIFRAGRRMFFFANEAERGRLALARAMEAKAGLMRGVTHDLKNPLGAANGMRSFSKTESWDRSAPTSESGWRASGNWCPPRSIRSTTSWSFRASSPDSCTSSETRRTSRSSCRRSCPTIRRPRSRRR